MQEKTTKKESNSQAYSRRFTCRSSPAVHRHESSPGTAWAFGARKYDQAGRPSRCRTCVCDGGTSYIQRADPAGNVRVTLLRFLRSSHQEPRAEERKKETSNPSLLVSLPTSPASQRSPTMPSKKQSKKQHARKSRE